MSNKPKSKSKDKKKANHFKNTMQKFYASTSCSGMNSEFSTNQGDLMSKQKATSPGVPNRGKDSIRIQARNLGQKNILRSINSNHITIVDGRAGSGKSYIAILYGINQLLKGTYQKVIIARPCVQSYGENLGFLPGTAQDKVLVYFQHLFDILEKQIDIGLIKKAIADKRIQIIPFAFMRGRNFQNAFVFCDEVQNTIPQQFRLIITRLSQGSKMILCGDSQQSDRCDMLGNGLADAIRKFRNVDGIGIVELGSEFIVRSSMVKTIEQIYEHDLAIKKGNNQPVTLKKVSQQVSPEQFSKQTQFDKRFNNDADIR